MTRWERVREILEAALSLVEAERARFVREHCGDDDALRDEVLSLLAHDAAGDEYLDTPPGSAALPVLHDVELPAGTRLGPWVVRDTIASGGMGTVYRGERADESFEKTVAIKLIKAGMDSAEVLARFENERRVLAGLEHPGIARLLDAGAAEDGRPYFVMEYVEGRPIHAYAKSEGLDLRERIELFARVCDAVQAAHQRYVVHRDLKPDNILVTPDGAPKLLDFGIAKALAGEGRDGAGTLGPSRLMTPEYASPEQVRGEHVTTASDVYSLGTVLYELLAGARPFDFSGASRAEIERIASTRQPERPSTAATSLRARLTGDLDTIVLKALHKEPSRRYTTAAELADDLRRHLASEPVLARPDSRAYRLSRYVRRNRTLVAAAGVVAVVLVGALVLQTLERERTSEANALADERTDDVRELARRLLIDLDATLERAGATTAEREAAVQTGLEHLAALSAQAADDVELRRDVARGHVKIGDLLGGAFTSNLGRHAEAREHYRRALALAEELGADEPADRAILVVALQRLGALEETMGTLETAAAHYRRAIELGIVEAADLRPSELRALQQVHDSLVSHSLRVGDHEGALAHAEESLALAESLASSFPDEFPRRLLAAATTQLGRSLFFVGRVEDAEIVLREALEIARESVEADPRSTISTRALCYCLNELARFLNAQGEFEESAALLEESATLLRALHDSDPADVQVARELGDTLNHLSHLYPTLGEHEKNVAIGTEFRDLALRLVERHPDHFEYRADLVGARLAVCRSQSIVGEHELALQEGLLAQRELQALAAERAEAAGIRRNLAAVDSELGRLHSRRADAADEPARKRELLELARAAFQDGLERLTELRDQGLLAASDERYIQDARKKVGECDAALASLPDQ